MDEICSICSKIFKNKAGLRAHKSAVHAEKNHACDVCDKKFKKKDQLNTHVSTHQDSIDICYACGITFTQKNNWTKHMKIYHLPQNFKCNHCPKSFIDKKALKNMLMHVQVFQQPAIKACLFWTPLRNLAILLKRKKHLKINI